MKFQKKLFNYLERLS